MGETFYFYQSYIFGQQSRLLVMSSCEYIIQNGRPDYHGTFYSINGNLLDTHLALPLFCDCFLSAQILQTLSWTLLVGQYLCAVLLKSPDSRLWFLGSSSDMAIVLNQPGLGHHGNGSNTLYTHFTTVVAWAGIYKPTGDSFCTKNLVNFILK